MSRGQTGQQPPIPPENAAAADERSRREPARWSLAGRATRLFLTSTTLLAAALAATSTYYLRQSVNDELDALTVSMIKELRFLVDRELSEVRTGLDGVTTVEFESGRLDPSTFERVARRFAETHPTPHAWRIWHMRVPKEWGDFGETSLIAADYPRTEPFGTTHRVEGGLRWRTEPLKADLAVSLVLDGRPHMSELRRYQWFATSVILAYGLIGAVMGLFLIQRVSKRLRRVADSARAVRELGTQVAIDDEGAPEEIRDVSEALQELLGNIRAESERNRVLLASMAHELRSPIQNLVGETEVALFQPRDNESYRRILESHLEEMRDLGDAIDNLVTICSKRDVPAGNEPEAFDLWDEAEIRLQRERSHARRRNVNLELVHDGNTRMEGDREGLLRALRNLAANAVEWSPDGGQVRVQLLGKDGQVIATVDDAGPGVPPEARLRIFDPFVRGPTASGRRIGYGLGLAIVKSAVDRQGGTVFVGESPLGGARFQMVLPKIPPEQPSAESVEGETLSA